jgi:anti-sigma B factor antagonist
MLSVAIYPTRIGLRLAVTGEIDLATVDRLSSSLDQALGQRPSSLMVDLADVTFMASAGVSALLSAYRRATADGITLAVTNCGRGVERILEISGVYRLLTGLEPAGRV